MYLAWLSHARKVCAAFYLYCAVDQMYPILRMLYGSVRVRNLSVSTFVMRSQNLAHPETVIVYISGRPFVLRDVAEPRRTLKLSDRAENLEAIELRLKNDILSEAQK